MKKKEADFAIIGGGIVGLSVAHGLLKQGCSVICIDGLILIFERPAEILALYGCKARVSGHLFMQHGHRMLLVYIQILSASYHKKQASR